MRPYSPSSGLNAFAAALQPHVVAATPSPHNLLPGLLGYLIRFAPLAFVPHRRTCFGQTPSPLVVHQGLQHFTAPPSVPLTSPTPKPCSIPCAPLGLSPEISQETCKAGYGRFKLNIRGHHLCYLCYRGGWHRIYPPLIPQALQAWEKPSFRKALGLPPSRFRALRKLRACCTP